MKGKVSIMLFDARSFRIMEQSADALWQKQKVISQNIANYDTPNYKAQSLTFSEVLNDIGKKEGQIIDVNVQTDYQTSARPDGNNVNMISENLELYKTYVQSSYLYDKINGKFTNIKTVLSQMPK